MIITTTVHNINYTFTAKLTDELNTYDPIKITITDNLNSFEPILHIIDNIKKNKTKIDSPIICNKINNYRNTISNMLNKNGD